MGCEIVLKGAIYLTAEEANLRLLTNVMSYLIGLKGLTGYPGHLPKQ